jgi:hypothetical protein
MELNEMDETMMDYYPMLLVDGHHGQYVPQVFAEQFNNRMWGLEEFDPDYQTILKGPDEEFYWECWDAVMDKAVFIHPITKVKYNLFPGDSGDLFMVKAPTQNKTVDSDSTVYFY